MSDLNDFGFSTVSEEDFKASSPEGKVVEEAVEQAKSGQIKTIEGQVDKIWKLLENKKSNISFCMHDSIIVDFSEEDMNVLKEKSTIIEWTNIKKN